MTCTSYVISEAGATCQDVVVLEEELSSEEFSSSLEGSPTSRLETRACSIPTGLEERAPASSGAEDSLEDDIE